MKNNLNLILLLLFISACSGLSDASKVLKNEKIRTTDEFLVEKRKPLVLPPNYEEIPSPNSVSKEKLDEKEKIKKILKVSNKENIDKKSSTIEDSILGRIKSD